LPTDVAINPTGTLALVTNNDSTGPHIPGAVTVFDLTTPIILPGYTVLVGPGTMGVAITPDGTRAYVVNGDNGYGETSVSVLDLTQPVVTVIDTLAPFGDVPTGVAITPDQAPTSIFTFTISGLTVAFDGSHSSSPVGGIKTYIWDFGDGSPLDKTSGAKVSHTYAGAGEFTVSLMVVNDAGTSTAVTFTGQTVSNHGLPRAKSTQEVFLKVKAPAKFIGKTHLHSKEEKLFLETKWSKSPTPHLKHYEIFAYHKKIATIKAHHKRSATIRLHPRNFPDRISKEYRRYLHHKYKIRAVDNKGLKSSFTRLIVRD
jgi:hypothetical protein